MANFNPNPSSSSSEGSSSGGTGSNDLNGNADDADDNGQSSSNNPNVNGSSHGGARPKIRRGLDSNSRPSLNPTGRPSGEDDQMVPTIGFNGGESPGGPDFESDNDDQANQVSNRHHCHSENFSNFSPSQVPKESNLH